MKSYNLSLSILKKTYKELFDFELHWVNPKNAPGQTLEPERGPISFGRGLIIGASWVLNTPNSHTYP